MINIPANPFASITTIVEDFARGNGTSVRRHGKRKNTFVTSDDRLIVLGVNGPKFSNSFRKTNPNERRAPTRAKQPAAGMGMACTDRQDEIAMQPQPMKQS